MEEIISDEDSDASDEGGEIIDDREALFEETRIIGPELEMINARLNSSAPSLSSTMNDCAQCEKYFKKPLLFRQHYYLVHHNGSHKCTECDAYFIKQYSLRRHIATIHASNSNNKCPNKPQKQYKYLKPTEEQKSEILDNIIEEVLI